MRRNRSMRRVIALCLVAVICGVNITCGLTPPRDASSLDARHALRYMSRRDPAETTASHTEKDIVLRKAKELEDGAKGVLKDMETQAKTVETVEHPKLSASEEKHVAAAAGAAAAEAEIAAQQELLHQANEIEATAGEEAAYAGKGAASKDEKGAKSIESIMGSTEALGLAKKADTIGEEAKEALAKPE